MLKDISAPCYITAKVKIVDSPVQVEPQYKFIHVLQKSFKFEFECFCDPASDKYGLLLLLLS